MLSVAWMVPCLMAGMRIAGSFPMMEPLAHLVLGKEESVLCFVRD
jgi:hypothetical protein